MIREDYIMREIDRAVRLIARLIFNKGKADYELSGKEEAIALDALYLELSKLISIGKINEAENLLFVSLDAGDKRYLEIAIAFYNQLNEHDDDFLEKNDYSREEVKEGLDDVLKLFSVVI